VLASLSDSTCQEIIRSVVRKPGTTVRIKEELHIPQSTFYRKVSELKDCGLLVVTEYEMGPDGKREPVYACPLLEAHLKALPEGIELEVVGTKECINKQWFELFFSSE